MVARVTRVTRTRVGRTVWRVRRLIESVRVLQYYKTYSSLPDSELALELHEAKTRGDDIVCAAAPVAEHSYGKVTCQ